MALVLVGNNSEEPGLASIQTSTDPEDAYTGGWL